MKIKNIKQKDLLDIFEVTTRGAIGHYFTGRRQPSVEQMIALAGRLGCTLDELMADDIYSEESKDIQEFNAGYEKNRAVNINRPPVIAENDWLNLPPQTRALVEDLLNKSVQGQLLPDHIKILQNMLDIVSKDC